VARLDDDYRSAYRDAINEIMSALNHAGPAVYLIDEAKKGGFLPALLEASSGLPPAAALPPQASSAKQK